MIHQSGLKHKMRSFHASISPGLCVPMNIKLIIWVTEVKRNFKCCFMRTDRNIFWYLALNLSSCLSDILYSGARSTAIIMGLSAFPLLTPILQLKISLQDEVLYKAFQLWTKKLSNLILLLLQFKKWSFAVACSILYECLVFRKKTPQGQNTDVCFL